MQKIELCILSNKNYIIQYYSNIDITVLLKFVMNNTDLFLPKSSTPLLAKKNNDIDAKNTKISLSDEQKSDNDNKNQSTNIPNNKTKPKNICFTCNKKTGLLGFSCKCDNNFCSMHRHAENHKCTYDFKSDAIQKLIKDNPLIAGDKVKDRI